MSHLKKDEYYVIKDERGKLKPILSKTKEIVNNYKCKGDRILKVKLVKMEV